MKLYLYEYNVTPNIEEKNEFLIKIEENLITYDSNTFEDSLKIEKIENMLLSDKEKLLSLKDVKHSNYKGGRQTQLQIIFNDICDEKILLIGNTDNKEVANFYKKLKNEIINLLK